MQIQITWFEFLNFNHEASKLICDFVSLFGLSLSDDFPKFCWFLIVLWTLKLIICVHFIPPSRFVFLQKKVVGQLDRLTKVIIINNFNENLVAPPSMIIENFEINKQTLSIKWHWQCKLLYESMQILYTGAKKSFCVPALENNCSGIICVEMPASVSPCSRACLGGRYWHSLTHSFCLFGCSYIANIVPAKLARHF